MIQRAMACLFVAVFMLTTDAVCLRAPAAEPIPIGSRLELMVDGYLFDKASGAKLVLHQPVRREIAIEHNAPWEGNNCGYHTVLQDGDVYRMYYMIAHNDCGKGEVRPEPAVHEIMSAYAESKDGIHWQKPDLGAVRVPRIEEEQHPDVGRL